MTSARALITLALLVASPMMLGAPRAHAQGHGPIFGLSTPTLGKGGWSLDVGTMARVVDDRATAMLRPMLSYGVTEDLQVSLSLPVPLRTREDVRPVRGATRMGFTPDVEILLGWRFHRHATGIGSRFESTGYLGLDYPTDASRAGVRTAPGVYIGGVSGYASRTVYAWAGGLYRRYMTPSGDADHPGDLAMYSLVVGYRPPPFQRDYPHPDWRIFVEAIGEWSARDVVAGVEQPNTGGHELYVGPTLLGLYGSWGISGWPVFPVWRDLHGDQSGDRARIAINVTYWF